jgi:hypothetical protein
VDESGTGSANSFSGLLAAFPALFPARFEPMNTALSFRRLIANDLPLLHGWPQREHVRAWWSRRESLDKVVDHYSRRRDPEPAWARAGSAPMIHTAN